jgi:pimeloyl-ACP methyl ester carboxylesterase
VTDDRPLLLLLHDRGAAPDRWRDFVPLFEERFRVRVPDLADADGIDAVRAILDGERCGVVGHGSGGALAQALAAEGRVEAMVLIDAPRAPGVDDATLASFDFPVLLLWGEEDDEVPLDVAEELNDAIPTSTLGVVPGCGHDLPAEAGATIGPMILEYLRARYLRAPHGHDHAHDGIVRIQLERRPPWVDLEDDERDDWFDVDEEGETS